jgi:hypothetical protein
MPYGIGLTLDKRTGAGVRDLWRVFEEAGVGKTPGQLGVPPHVTFALFSSGKPDVLVSLVEALSVEDPSLKLVPFGAFLGEKHTLYLHAVLAPDLVQAHVTHIALARARGLSCDRLYTPGSIVFHCTLAVEIEDSDFLTGVEICRSHPEILEGCAETVELFEFFPAKQVHGREIVTGLK